MIKYALIQENKIVKFKTIDDNDDIILPKLIAHNYLEVIEDIIPDYDIKTQMLIDNYEIHIDKVLHVWTIKERPAEEILREALNGI